MIYVHFHMLTSFYICFNNFYNTITSFLALKDNAIVFLGGKLMVMLDFGRGKNFFGGKKLFGGKKKFWREKDNDG